MPTSCEANVIDVADNVTCGMAVPVSSANWMPDPARTSKRAARRPVPVGLNTTLMVQLFLDASDVPQLFVWSKSPPIIETFTLIAALPLLVNVAGLAALLFVTAVLGKLMNTGERLCAWAAG